MNQTCTVSKVTFKKCFTGRKMETFPREKVTRKNSVKKSERIENNNLLMLEHTSSDNMLNVKFVRNGSIKSV